MKKFVALLLAAVSVMALSVAAFAEAPKVTVGGEGNFGYNFTDKVKENATDKVATKDGGACFSDWNVKFTVDVNEKISFFGKVKSQDILTENFITDELTGTVKLTDGITLKTGYFGFGFGGEKDILDAAMGDFKSKAGIQIESKLMDVLTGKLYFAPQGKEIADNAQGGAVGARLDYSRDVYGVGLIYGQTDYDLKEVKVGEDKTYPFKNATVYTLNVFIKPLKDLKTYAVYSLKNVEYKNANRKDQDDKVAIVGALFTPAELPWEARVEYDLSDENAIDAWAKKGNPWAVRVDYKLNPNAKIELNRNQKKPGEQETALKLNITF